MSNLFNSFISARDRLLDKIKYVQSESLKKDYISDIKYDEEDEKKEKDIPKEEVEEFSFNKIAEAKRDKEKLNKIIDANRAIHDDGEEEEYEDEIDLTISGRRNLRALMLLDQQERFESEIFGDLKVIHPKSRDLPRNPVLEGIYVPPKPIITESNYKTVVSRCLRQDPNQEKLFTDLLLTLEPLPTHPDPRHPSIHPTIVAKVEEAFETIVKLPEEAKGNFRYYDFNVFLRKMYFSDFEHLSKEDLMCLEIEECYKEFQRRVGINLVRYYNTRIDALKGLLKSQLSDLDTKRTSSSESADFAVQRAISTLEDLIKMREEKDLEEKEHLSLLSHIYKLWTRVKKWRELEGRRLNLKDIQLEPEKPFPFPDEEKKEEEEVKKPVEGKYLPFIGNPLRLLMEVTQPDFSEEKQIYDRSIVEEVDERELMYSLKSKLYALNKQAAVPPSEVLDKKSLFILVNARRSDCRQPGVKVWNPVLDKRANMTDFHSFTYREKERRESLVSVKLKLKLYIDGTFLEETPHHELNYPGLYANIDHSFGVRVREKPKEMKVEVLQAGYFGDFPIATFYLPFPTLISAPALSSIQFVGSKIEVSEYQSIELEMHDRSYDEIAKDEKDAYVRDALQKDAKFAVHADRYIRGEMDYHIAWDVDEEKNPVGKEEEVALVQKFGGLPRDKIQDVVKSLKQDIDPYDPRNASLLNYQKKVSRLTQRGKTFNCEQLPTELQLCSSDADTITMGRLAILQLRNKTESIRKEPVPLFDEEISNNLYSALDDNIRAKTDLEFALFYGAKQALHRPRRINSVSEVVNDHDAPEFSVDVEELQILLNPTRKLRVEPNAREPAANPSSCRLIVQVIRATNIPCRASGKRQKKKIDDNLTECSPIVEVKFQNRTRRTTQSKGTNPNWNQTLSFEFRPPNNQFIPSVIRHCADEIYFNIFDNVTTTEVGANKARKILTNEKRWLGSLTIPFSTLYSNDCRLEGFFKLDTPVLNLAYTAPSNGGSYIWVFCTLDPPLVPIPIIPPNANLMENPIYRICQNWLDEVRLLPQCQKRYLKCFAEDENQDTYIVTQYIYPIAPPDPKEGTFTRFVALIPYLADNFATEAVDTWCSVPSFLNLGFGDWEEHAILLGNYFLYQDIKAVEENRLKTDSVYDTFIVLGTGVPEGDSVYVLRREISYGRIRDVWIYNACTGTRYRFDDPRCPLRDIGCVANMENMWANIQRFSDLNNLSYDFQNPAYWKPMLPLNLQPSYLAQTTASSEPHKLNFGAKTNLIDHHQPNQQRSVISKALADAQKDVDNELDGGELLSKVVEEDEDEIPCWNFCFLLCGIVTNVLTREKIEDRLRSINAMPITYRETSADHCFIREGYIRSAIQSRFEANRTNVITRWDYAISEVLRGLLADRFEFIKQGHLEKDLDPESHSGLKKVREIYRDLYGVPLNFADNLSNDMRYHENNDDNPIVQAVLNTGIHTIDNPNARFAVAVHVFPYYNNITSVWVYIAVLNMTK